MSSLLPLDLENLVLPTFNIDLYDAKAGQNEDVITLAFRVEGQAPAEDLETFIEREGRWILDTDVSSGEDNTDHYLVFVEIKRNQQAAERICYLTDLIERVTGVLNWKFTVGSGLVANKATEENIASMVPMSPADYNASKEKAKVTALENFFNNTTYNTVVVEGDQIKLQQFYALPTPQSELILKLESTENLADLRESDILESTQAIWLQKKLGANYTIEQYEDKFLLSRPGHEERYLISLNV
jgi:hypothetical protein